MEEGGMTTGQSVKLFRKRNRGLRAGMSGAGLVKTMLLLLAALAVLLLLAIGFFEGRKAYWDFQVKGMCEKDGGTRIYEYAHITRQAAQENGLLIGSELVIPPRPKQPSSSDYYIDYESDYLKTGAPSVFRARTTVVRARDMKVLAEMISYSRVGGDFPTFAHPSSMGCNDADIALMQFRTAISIKEETK
jgi:hypothetical protein